MPIRVDETAIPEVKIIIGTRFLDERGFFTETYKESEYEAIGIPRFVQDNLSESSRGVIRGLHWQEAPYGQGKLVSCISGSILDVAVDVRKDSPYFGQHFSIELTENNSKSLWIPEGFAHGFQALEDNTRVLYKVTNYWSKEKERSLNFRDKSLNIAWVDIPVSASQKDIESPSLDKI